MCVCVYVCACTCWHQEYLRRYVSQFEHVLVNIREKCRLDSSAVDTEEWSTFQNSLRIIQTCGNMLTVNCYYSVVVVVVVMVGSSR